MPTCQCTQGVPVGAGLSSSAALECAVAMALAELFDRTPVDLGALVRAGIRAENEIVGAATGGMDQVVAVHAQVGHCLRLDCLSWELAQVPLPLAEHDLAILVINTNARCAPAGGQRVLRPARRRRTRLRAARRADPALRCWPMRWPGWPATTRR